MQACDVDEQVGLGALVQSSQTKATTSTTPVVTEVELWQADFAPEQIVRLTALRDSYPFLEWVESRDDWNRLVFLKWCHATRRFTA